MVRKLIKRDSLGRRTDRVKKRELALMMRLQNEGLTFQEIAERLGRKPQTIKNHIEAARRPDENSLFPQAEAERLKEAQHIEHISSLQRFVREIIDSIKSIPHPADTNNWDDLEQTHNSLWQAFRRITGDARWSMLAAHLGEYVFDIYNMRNRLEPPALKREREHPEEKIVIVRVSKDDEIELMNEAFALVSEGPLKLVAEEADTQEWESYGLERWCRWCPTQLSD